MIVSKNGNKIEMSLDDVWAECLRMWKDTTRDGSYCKVTWLDAHGYKAWEFRNCCFFCEYDKQHGGGEEVDWCNCSACPAFPATGYRDAYGCESEGINWGRPDEFYAELVRLNEERKKS